MKRARRMLKADKKRLGPLTRKATGIVKLPPGKTDRELLEEALVEKHGGRR